MHYRYNTMNLCESALKVCNQGKKKQQHGIGNPAISIHSVCTYLHSLTPLFKSHLSHATNGRLYKACGNYCSNCQSLLSGSTRTSVKRSTLRHQTVAYQQQQMTPKPKCPNKNAKLQRNCKWFSDTRSVAECLTCTGDSYRKHFCFPSLWTSLTAPSKNILR